MSSSVTPQSILAHTGRKRPAGADAALAGLWVAAAVFCLRGMSRSLWLDEAWVANSIAAPSLRGMFDYPAWLQTSPPLFLLLSRGAIRLLGLSNAALRFAPLLLGLAGMGGFLALARRVLSAPFALLAGALLVLSPAAVEYSHTAKQYSGEMAAAVLIVWAAAAYFEDPGARRYRGLVLATAVALPLGYSSAFLVPGLLLAVYAAGRRPVLLAAVSGSMLAALYFLFIRPNSSADLRRFWRVDADTGLHSGSLAALAIVVAAAAWALARPTKTSRKWISMVCACPCLLLALASLLRIYPLTYRTRLFALPCFLLLAAMMAEDIGERATGFVKSGVKAAALIAAIVALLIGIRTQLKNDARLPKEDPAGAVAFLQHAVAPRDLLLVHPSVKESFVLYANMDHWTHPAALYGDTGWPCCARGRVWIPGTSTEAAVNRDIDRMVPHGFSGRVWMLYTIRPTHWDYVGLDESKIWRHHLADRGCIISPPDRRFENLAISTADCARVN